MKIKVPTERLATAVIETAIHCGPEPHSMRQYIDAARNPVFDIYIEGALSKLTECRKTITQQPYYNPSLFDFSTALKMEDMRTPDDET